MDGRRGHLGGLPARAGLSPDGGGVPSGDVGVHVPAGRLARLHAARGADLRRREPVERLLRRDRVDGRRGHHERHTGIAQAPLQ
ncbi:hypothetical protein B7486_56340, partial [cyanobacterium TDX16]